jgi:hypothetical protein
VTPVEAWLLVSAFVAFLILGAVLLEQTEAGRQWSDRMIERIAGQR